MTAHIGGRLPDSERSLSIARRKSLPIYSQRPRSLGNDPITRKERAELKAMRRELGPVYRWRPKTWGDCQKRTGPCGWVSCVHHLYLEADPVTGAVKINFPGLDVDEIPETCSLKVAGEGSKDGGEHGAGHTLYRVGEMLNLTEEWARQIQISGLAKVRAHSEKVAALGTDELDEITGDDDAGEGP